MTRLQEMQSLDGRVALVTGGAGHVARAVADVLAELRCRLVLSDRDEHVHDVSRDVAAEFGIEAAAFAADLSVEEHVRKLAADAPARFGRLDVVVHCGAMVSAENLPGWTAAFDQQQPSAWRKALEVNLTAPFLLTQGLAGALREARGSVITIGSIYGMLGADLGLYAGTPMGNSAGYAASKGGLLQLTRWLATVLAPDVRVNMITLGGIERNQPQAFQAKYVAKTPLARMGREDDIKGAIAFLASPASAYVTGQNLVVDGGFGVW